MDSDTKREVAEVNVADVAPGDNTTRARNRTVMLSPEMTGTMRSRLGGEAPGEVFQPRGMLDEPDAGLSEEWGTLDPKESNGSVFMNYSDGSEDSSGVREWESNDATVENFEPQARQFNDDAFSEADPSGGFESPQWDEPKQAAPTESPVISQPRIVRSTSFSREGHSEAGVGELPQRSTKVSGVDEAVYTPEDSASSRIQSAVSQPVERMVSKPEIEPVKHEQIVWKSPSQLVGFLISYDHDPLGSYVELRKGRLLVTSEADASGNCLIVDHDTVSPMHAVMRIADGGSVQVLDQLSEYGTRIVRGGSSEDAGEEVLLSGDKASIHNGDILSFGERKFHVCLVIVR